MSTIKNFAGIADEYAKLENAKIVMIPVPYDGTSTWQKGADKGPEALLHAAENMETYDIETDTEVYKQGIHIAPAVTENGTPEIMVKAVYAAAKDFIKRNKFVTVVGGEHSASIGTIRAFNELFEDLTVLHIDAHADLRKEYNGSRYNHACAAHEASQATNLVQVGIRSMDILEKTLMDEDKTFFAHEMMQDEYWVDNVIEACTDNVFITFDLDALDPSILPATGTPEPGGLFWYETMDFLKRVFDEKNVVGFDIMELCPNENDKTSDLLAAKLYYKMLSYKFQGEEAEDNYDNTYLAKDKSGPGKLKDNDED